MKFGQLVQKQHAVVCQGDFARLGVLAAPDHRYVGDGVVRAAERPYGHQSAVGGDLAGDRMDLGGLKRFGKGHGRQDGCDAFGQHRLSAAGRPDHDDVVPAGGRDLQGTLDVFLAFYIGKVQPGAVFVFVKQGLEVYVFGFGFVGAFEKGGNLFEGVHAVHFEAFHYGGFAGVLTGQDNAPEAFFLRLDGDGERSPDAFERAVEREFAHDHVVGGGFVRDLSRGGQDADGDRQVERCAFLAHVGRCHVDRDLFAWPAEAVGLEGGVDAVRGLLDGVVRQTDQVVPHSLRDIDLDGNGNGRDAFDGTSVCLYQHGVCVCFFLSLQR